MLTTRVPSHNKLTGKGIFFLRCSVREEDFGRLIWPKKQKGKKKRVTPGPHWFGSQSLRETLSTSASLVLHFPVDVKHLSEAGKTYGWPRPARCPGCGSSRLWGHGFVERYFEGFGLPLWVKRFRCPDCRAVHTLRPEAFMRALRYRAEIIVSALREKIAGKRWLRSVSRQTQQYWLRSLRRFCSGLNTCWALSLDDLGRFCRSRLIMTEQCAPLRL